MNELAGSGDSAVIRLLKSKFTQLRQIHALLEMEGYTMPPLKEPKVGANDDPK
jgi:hypothetical protein